MGFKGRCVQFVSGQRGNKKKEMDSGISSPLSLFLSYLGSGVGKRIAHKVAKTISSYDPWGVFGILLASLIWYLFQ